MHFLFIIIHHQQDHLGSLNHVGTGIHTAFLNIPVCLRFGHVIPLHDHYHVQMSYILKGSAKITLADGTEKLCKAGDAAAFAPNEAHSVITAEPDTVIMDVFTPLRLDHLANHKKEE